MDHSIRGLRLFPIAPRSSCPRFPLEAGATPALLVIMVRAISPISFPRAPRAMCSVTFLSRKANSCDLF
jgi:hypothetical protein